MAKLFNNYIITSMLCNSFFKFIDTWNAKVIRKNDKKTDILLGEKIMIISFAGLIGPYFLPYNFIKNIDKMQLYIQNKKSNDYDIYEKQIISDYYFP